MSNPKSGIYLRNREKTQAIDVDLPNLDVEVDGDVSVDLISGLPEPILHHILCFLTQREAVQTSVLSKSWRHIGPTRPKFDFCEYHFNGDQRKFISVMESTIDRCLNRKLSFRKFCLEMQKHNDLSKSFLAAWIPLVLDNMSIKSFHLSFFYFDVPTNLFRTESLEKLYLKKCNLKIYCVGDVKLKHLKSLKLIDVYIEDETLEFLLFGCPLIEDLVISQCRGLKNIKLKECFNLKYFENWNSGRVVDHRIEINIQSIESISIDRNWFHHHHTDSDDGNNVFPLLKSLHLVDLDLSSEFINCLSCHVPALEDLTLAYCHSFEEYQLSSQTLKHQMIRNTNMFGNTVIDDGDSYFPLLKSLCLVDTYLSPGWFDSLSSRFPSLETLNIEYCDGEYQISSQSIKHLKIVGSAMAVIDAPNLVKFEYEGPIPTSISFEKTSVNWKSKLVLQSVVNFEYTASSWCLDLYEFLKGFFGSQISLDISIDHFKGNHKHLKDFPPLVAARDTLEPIAVEHMTMRSMGHFSSSISALINNMFCFVHPRNMTQFLVKAIGENQLCEYQKKALLSKNQLCWYLKKVLLSERVMKHCYLWKQDLKEASMEIDPSLLTSIIDGKIEKEPFMFRLKWKE